MGSGYVGTMTRINRLEYKESGKQIHTDQRPTEVYHALAPLFAFMSGWKDRSGTFSPAITQPSSAPGSTPK